MQKSNRRLCGYCFLRGEQTQETVGDLIYSRCPENIKCMHQIGKENNVLSKQNANTFMVKQDRGSDVYKATVFKISLHYGIELY